MTLHEIKLLHAFNSWANNRLLESLALLPEELYLRDLKSSHGGIHGTLTHMVAAQKIWLSRWVGTPDQKMLTTADMPGLQDVRTLWERVGFDTAKFLGTMTDKKLGETFTMTTARGETFTHIYWQAIQHLVDHCSYHRGQIVGMMRQLGVKPPNTGLIAFYRETGKTA